MACRTRRASGLEAAEAAGGEAAVEAVEVAAAQTGDWTRSFRSRLW